MRNLLFTAAAAALLLTGCNKKEEQQVQNNSPTIAAETPVDQPKPAYTKKEWRAALKSTFEESAVKTDEDGITEYSACFKKKDDGKCALFAFGKRDAFRKIDHLTPIHTRLNRIVNAQTQVGTYIAAIECEAPSLLLEPAVNKRGGWLFMEKVAFMADGDVVLERDFEHNRVDRDNESSWIHEKAAFIPTSNELDGLKRFTESNSQIIRITGQKGYITLPKEKTREFAEDAKATLTMLETINNAFKDSGGPTCAASSDSRETL